ncbi:MAG: protease complex subunit PrcB family protein [Flavobacteriaceae bacterium]
MKNLLYILVFIAIGCKTTAESSKDKQKELMFETVAQANLYGDGEEGIEEGNLIVKNKAEWDTLINKMDTANKVSATFKGLPIDFSKEIIICVFDKLRSSGGVTIAITKMEMNEKSVSVFYSIKKPLENQVSTSVMTQPFHIVKMKRRTENIVFTKSED